MDAVVLYRNFLVLLILFIYTPAHAGNMFHNSYSKSIAPGYNTYIYKNDEILPDCSASNLTVKIKIYPKHGTLTIARGSVENNYSKSQPQSKCPSKISNGVKAYYQSDARYRGKDKAVISVTDEAGNTKDTTIYLNIN